MEELQRIAALVTGLFPVSKVVAKFIVAEKTGSHPLH